MATARSTTTPRKAAATPVVGARGPYAKTAERRREILEVAADVFGRNGFRGSSVREIADRVGLSEQGVLHHFGGKPALLAAVLEQRDLDAKAQFASRVDEPIGTVLRDLVDTNSRLSIIRLFTTVSAESTDPEHPAHEHFRSRYAEAIELLTGGFERDQQQGRIRADVDPNLVARMAFALMDGLQVQWLLRKELDMIDPFRAFLRLLEPAPTAAEAVPSARRSSKAAKPGGKVTPRRVPRADQER